VHINPTCGVAKCTADEAVLQPALDEMGAINAQNKTAAAAAEQRQLERSTAANASTSSTCATKQRTLAVCREAVSRLGLARPGLGARGLLRHQHEESSATARSARAVMQKTVAAATKTRAEVVCLKLPCFS